MNEGIPLVFLLKKYYLKDDNKTSHWFGHSKCKPLDLGDFYKIKTIINELEDCVTGTTIGQLDSGLGFANQSASTMTDTCAGTTNF